MAGIAEGVIAERISKGVERIVSRKKLTPQDLTVLLLHEESKSLGRLERGMKLIAAELREFRKEDAPPAQSREGYRRDQIRVKPTKSENMLTCVNMP